MPSLDPRIDAYIAKSQPFAQPVLVHLREVVHAACPEVEETMKWSFPHFVYRGGILCSMASFKAHCAFGFWLAKDVIGDDVADDGMGHFGRITSVKDLPSKAVLTKHIRKAMALNEAGVKLARSAATRAKASASALDVPLAFAKALQDHPEVQARFDAMSPSHRREYCEWIASAKKAETVERRVAKAIELIAEGKSQNWQYETRK